MQPTDTAPLSTATGPSASPPLHITQKDMERLRLVVDRNIDGKLGPAAEALELELDRATVVADGQVPADVLTMRSRALCEDLETGKQRELVLSYPNETDPSEGKVSVLAPVGLALLGLRVGDTIRWPMPNGRETVLKLVKILYQPEAAGESDL